MNLINMEIKIFFAFIIIKLIVNNEILLDILFKLNSFTFKNSLENRTRAKWVYFDIKI